MEGRDRQAALDGARQGDALALGKLLQSFQPYVRVILRAFHDDRLQSRLDDSDLVQDVFLEAHRGFAGFRGTTVGEFAMWMRRIALRSAGRASRSFAGAAKRDPAREQPAEDLDQLPAGAGDSPSDQAIRHEQAARMADALARLPEDMQQVLLDRHVADLPHAAIAQRLGRTEAAVRMLYVRALRRLRELCQG
jgi:RNA polymerase sigma-70 factor (ECF subfamily)